MFSHYLLFAAVIFQLSETQQVLPKTDPQYVSLVKCNFVVFGQFDYEQAKQACQTRQGSLAFFTSPSEDHAVRKNIAWNLMPGFQRGQFWVGQLWLGIQRQALAPTGWAWDNPIVQGYPVPFASWISGDASRISASVDCVLAREDGWVPFSCNGTQNNVKYSAGALCTSVARFPPTDAAANNYCQNFLLPASSSSTDLPLIIKKNYFLISGTFAYDAIVQTCAQQQGQPSTARSAEEYQFITKNVDFNTVNNAAWLGLKRSSPGSTQFAWVDSMPNNFTEPWLDGQPDNSGDCVSYESGADGRIGWKIRPCTDQISVLCETFQIP